MATHLAGLPASSAFGGTVWSKRSPNAWLSLPRFQCFDTVIRLTVPPAWTGRRRPRNKKRIGSCVGGGGWNLGWWGWLGASCSCIFENDPARALQKQYSFKILECQFSTKWRGPAPLSLFFGALSSNTHSTKWQPSQNINFPHFCTLWFSEKKDCPLQNEGTGALKCAQKWIPINLYKNQYSAKSIRSGTITKNPLQNWGSTIYPSPILQAKPLQNNALKQTRRGWWPY